ncbi:hypothetical protein NDU88_007297 [Pleurodeles waltl]|uniref:Uncharacterized protein n=1 Tax=Pleurodeles waltl TaxID=8319 RepID=A0AAV7RPW1_PLEWA|nr:hypothetical protein NDU88_007297 [Pleurodeles waltl]
MNTQEAVTRCRERRGEEREDHIADGGAAWTGGSSERNKDSEPALGMNKEVAETMDVALPHNVFLCKTGVTDHRSSMVARPILYNCFAVSGVEVDAGAALMLNIADTIAETENCPKCPMAPSCSKDSGQDVVPAPENLLHKEIPLEYNEGSYRVLGEGDHGMTEDYSQSDIAALIEKNRIRKANFSPPIPLGMGMDMELSPLLQCLPSRLSLPALYSSTPSPVT